jgi:hypothetical protein
MQLSGLTAHIYLCGCSCACGGRVALRTSWPNTLLDKLHGIFKLLATAHCLPHMRTDQACTMHASHLPRLQLYPHGAQTYPAANDVDLFVKQGSAPPDVWAQSVADGWAL